MFEPESVLRHTLPNGLTVLVRADRSAPVGAIVTYVKTGYFDEPDEVAGISHVLEHMFFKGTPTRGVGEIARETKAVGGYLNAHTIYDHTSYFAVLPREGFQRGLEIQADAYAHALLDGDELARELEVIIQEARRKLDSPGAVAMETLFEVLHDRHRIRRWRIGHEGSLRALTRDRVQAFYRNFYRPGNTILAVVGDVDVDVTLREIEVLYGPLADGAVAREPGLQESSAPGFRYRELSGDITQTHLVFGWRTPGALHRDTPLLDLFAVVLGTGRGSRLYRAVRERQLASAVAAENYTPAEIGVFTMRAEGPPPHGRAAAAAMWRELEQARDRGIDPREVARAQRLVESRWLRRLESMEGQATFLAEWEALGDWRLSQRYYDATLSAGAGEVADAARRLLDASQASLLVYRPESAPVFARDADQAGRVVASPESLASDLLPVAPAPEAAIRTAPPASVLREAQIGAVHVFRTRRGVPILVRRRPGSPIVHVGIYSAVGSARESDQLAGLATVSARATVKGSEQRSAEAIAYASELLGGSIAPSITADGMGWTFSVPVTRTADAVALFAEVVLHPRLAGEAVETERTIALANLAELRDDMYRYPVRLLNAAAYDGHPYGRGLLGSEETLRAIGEGDVRAWHQSSVLTAPVVIAAVGDVDEPGLAGMLASAFDEVQMAPSVPLAAPTWPAAPRQVAEHRDRAQTALALAFPAPTRRDPERFAALLVAGIASGLGGRFFEALREQRSLAYTVHAVSMERVQSGAFAAYIATSPQQEDEAREGLLAQFARLREEPVSEEELTRARTYALGSHAIALQSGGVVLGEMVDSWLFGTGLNELEAFEQRLRAVTVDGVLALAQRYFDPERRVEGVVRGEGQTR